MPRLHEEVISGALQERAEKNVEVTCDADATAEELCRLPGSSILSGANTGDSRGQ